MSHALDRVDRLTPTESFLIALLCVIVALSGYFFIEVGETFRALNRVARIFFILVILGLLFVALFVKNTHRVPLVLLPLALLIFYMVAVSAVRNPPTVYLPAFFRWIIYLSAALYFYRLSDPMSGLKLFFTLTAVLYLASAFFDLTIGRVTQLNQATRLAGSLGSPIGFATTLFATAMGIQFLYYRTRKTLYMVLLGLIVAAIVLTGTRSLTVAVLAVIPGYHALHSRLSLKNATGLLLGVTLSIGAFVWILENTDVGLRLVGGVSDVESDSSWLFRLMILQVVAESLTAQQRLFGLGLGSFATWFEGQTGIENVAPHFEAVWIYTEGGIVGVALYVVALGLIIAKLIRLRRRGRIPAALLWLAVILLLAQQTAFQLANPTWFYQAMIPVFAALGAALGLARRTGRVAARGVATRERPKVIAT